ncbi:MAG: hypothetical protein KF878_18655 [Planctomycetes bacterium]|nr:hypothetical protein [Planctomycetota bacterium]
MEKPVEAFSRRGRGRQSRCKECAQSWEREHYRADPGRRDAIAKRNEAQRDLIRAYLLDYFSTHPCVDCGVADPRVLEFDHVRGVKVAAVAALIGRSLASVVAEVVKCEVRCGNCHRRKTARERNWWIWRAARAMEEGRDWS